MLTVTDSFRVSYSVLWAHEQIWLTSLGFTIVVHKAHQKGVQEPQIA